MNNHPFPSSIARFILAAASRRWLTRLAGVILALTATLALAAEPPRKVLVVYSDNRLLPGLAVIDEALDSVLRTEYGPEIELLNEFFDLDRPGPAAYEDDLVAFLRKKYAGTQIDAIVAVRGPALKFLLQRRDQFLPGVPVVHVSISTQELAGMALPRDVIGVPVELQPEKTIELALRLHPSVRRVVVITGHVGVRSRLGGVAAPRLQAARGTR